jgi:hypothetical protein
VPVHDATHKWRNESGTRFGTSNRLGDRKDERQIASNTFLFQDFSGLDTLPSGGNLDENAGLVDTNFFVEVNDLTSFGECCFGIKGETSIDLGRNVSGNNLGDLDTKVDGDLVLLS